MTDVFRRIASIQSRFQVATAAPTAGAAKRSTDDFSSVLASTRAATSSTAALGVGGAARATTSTSAGDAQTSAIATLARSLGIATGTGATSLAGTTATPVSRAARDALGGTTAATSAAGTVPESFTEHRDAIARVAIEEGVPASLLGALVWSESGFDPEAVSSAGARGLAQLMPATAEGLGVDIDDPADNLRGGARYLRQMLDRFGRADLALAAYNAGPNAVIRFGGVPPYQETQTYVTRVLARATTLAGGTP